MPLKTGKSQATKSFNIGELIKRAASKKRARAIRTLMKRRNLSYRKAKILQAKAIGMAKARES